MAITVGTVTQVATSQSTVTLQAPPATGGTAPYFYQWHRSQEYGFTPSEATAIDGATELTLNDVDLQPNAIYYYVLVVTDSTVPPP